MHGSGIGNGCAYALVLGVGHRGKLRADGGTLHAGPGIVGRDDGQHGSEAGRGGGRISGEPSKVVPRIVGMTCGAAQTSKLIHALGLRVKCLAGSSTGQSPGLINQQEPAEGAAIPDSRLVAGYVEPAAPDLVEVPDVLGARVADAMQKVAGAGLSALVHGGQKGAAQQVSDQKPRGGEKVKPGSRVELVLAVQYQVPALIGLDCKTADAVARKSRFPGVQCTEVIAQTDEKVGAVFEQKPAAQIVLAQPMVIAVAIHKAPPPTLVPAVVQHTVRSALALLSGAQLSAQISGASRAPLAVVIAQAPAAGTSVPEKSLVQLTTAIEVPDVIERAAVTGPAGDRLPVAERGRGNTCGGRAGSHTATL